MSGNITPWYNTAEWTEVYSNIYEVTSTLITKQNALDQLLIWKARSPFLPSGVESTMSLLHVHIQDQANSYGIYDDHVLRLAYSSALMRFVNHMLDKETAKGLSLYRAAKMLGVPDWIIELRHDTAHSNKLPHLDLLREASYISLHWLQMNYWDKHKLCISDLVVGKISNETEIEKKITVLMNFCVSLSICSHPKFSIKNLAQISDAYLRDCLVNDATQLLEHSLDFSNLKSVTISILRHKINTQAKKLLTNDASSSYVNKTLLSDDSAFLSLELWKHLDYFSYNSNKPLNRDYIECFDGLLNFLFTHDLLRDVLLELIKVTQNENGNNIKKCTLAAKWLSVILQALHKNQQFMDKINKTKIDIMSKDETEIQKLYYHWYPNEKKRTLLLQFLKPVPKEFTNINFIQPIISTYNSFLTFFIIDLLNLVRPKLPNSVIGKISQLAKVIASPEKLPITSSKIYTADDLEMAINLEVKNELTQNIEIQGQQMEYEDENRQKFGIWQLASQNHNWSACPIGQLPWTQLSMEIMEV